MPRDGVFGFGPYQFDTRARRLFKGGADVSLSVRQLDLLHLLVTRAGEVVRKDDLIAAAWKEITVGHNSLVKALMEMRLALDTNPNRYIESVPRRGYRLTADLTRMVEHQTADLVQMLAGDRALVDGIAALATMTREECGRAIALFALAVERDPADPAYRAGLANAYLMRYEGSIGDSVPDAESLRLAEHEARQACALNDQHAEALSVLGFILFRLGDRGGALSALRRATKLEPHIWRHHFRLAWVSWGEERLAAARAVLALSPDLPAARFLIATVLIAMDRLAEAEAELDLGLAAMRAEVPGRARFAAVGLYWLKGLLLYARGVVDEAMAAWQREVDGEASGHLYARKYAAHAYCAMGACRLRQRRDSAARAAFREALARVPHHPMAHAGLAMLDADLEDQSRMTTAESRAQHAAPPQHGEQAAPLHHGERAVPLHHGEHAVPLHHGEHAVPLPEGEHAVSLYEACAHGARAGASGDADAAARIVYTALGAEPAGSAGRFIPIDPLLGVQQNKSAWADVLALLRSRAR